METNDILIVLAALGFLFIVLQTLVVLLDKHLKEKSLRQFNNDIAAMTEEMKLVVDQTTAEWKRMFIDEHIKEEQQILYGDSSTDMVRGIVHAVNDEIPSQLVRGISLTRISDQIPPTGSLAIDGEQVYGYINGHNGLSWYNLGPFKTCSVWSHSEDWIGTVDQFKLEDLHVNPDSWVVYRKIEKENEDE